MASVENVEEMVGTREAAAVATESGGAVATEYGGVATRRWRRLMRDGDETGDVTGGPRDETGDKMAATAGDERDGSDRWGNVYG